MLRFYLTLSYAKYKLQFNCYVFEKVKWGYWKVHWRLFFREGCITPNFQSLSNLCLLKYLFLLSTTLKNFNFLSLSYILLGKKKNLLGLYKQICKEKKENTFKEFCLWNCPWQSIFFICLWESLYLTRSEFKFSFIFQQDI